MGVEAVVFYWFLVFYGPNEAALYGPYDTKADCAYSRSFGTGEPRNARRVSGCFAADEKTLWWPIVDRSEAERRLKQSRLSAQ